MLETTLDVAPAEDEVAFDLVVENGGDDDVVLSFSDAQRAAFAVAPDGGETVWRSDADRMFAQMLGEETVPAGGRVTFGEVWTDPEPGQYRVDGEVTCRDRELTASATFSV